MLKSLNKISTYPWTMNLAAWRIRDGGERAKKKKSLQFLQFKKIKHLNKDPKIQKSQRKRKVKEALPA